METNSQLIKKIKEGGYNNVYPIAYIDGIIDKESNEKLSDILIRYNNIMVPWQGDVASTRNRVPSLMRRQGIVITYITDLSEIVTEVYKGTVEDIKNNWADNINWELVPDLKFVQDNTSKLPDGTITPEKLSPALQELISQSGSVVNMPDDEDLEQKDMVLKFKDRPYNSELASGKGYKILRKNWVNVGTKTINLLTQDVFNQYNTIYEIRYDFDLNGQEITIPEGCVLDFQGGSLNNGILTGSNTSIKTNIIKIFGLEVEFKGTWNVDDCYAEWFGTFNEKGKDDSDAIQKCIDSFHKLTLVNKEYFLEKEVYLTECVVEGCGFYRSIIRVNKPIVIRSSGVSISDVQFLYIDTNNRPEQCILFQNDTGSDIYNVTFNRCLFNGVKTVITVNAYISALTFNECWFNRNDNIWKDVYQNIYGYHRKGIVFNNCMLDWTSERILAVVNTGMIFYGCYFGFFSSYAIYIDNMSMLSFIDCTFEVMNELEATSASPLIRLGNGYFERCRFTSNRATNYYWFQSEAGAMSIIDSSFSDWGEDRRISGLFVGTLLQNKDIGSIKLDRVIVNSVTIKSPKDFTSDVYTQNYPIFNVVNGYGISIVDKAYNVEELKDGEKYTLFDIYKSNPLPVVKEFGKIKYLAVSDNYYQPVTISSINAEGRTVNKSNFSVPSLYTIRETAAGDYVAVIYMDNFYNIHVISDPNNIVNEQFFVFEKDTDNIIIKYNRTAGSAINNITFNRISI